MAERQNCIAIQRGLYCDWAGVLGAQPSAGWASGHLGRAGARAIGRAGAGLRGAGAGAGVGRWGAVRARGEVRHGRRACDTVGPVCDTAGPRATTRPVFAPGCAQLGLVGCFVHSNSVFDPV